MLQRPQGHEQNRRHELENTPPALAAICKTLYSFFNFIYRLIRSFNYIFSSDLSQPVLKSCRANFIQGGLHCWVVLRWSGSDFCRLSPFFCCDVRAEGTHSHWPGRGRRGDVVVDVDPAFPVAHGARGQPKTAWTPTTTKTKAKKRPWRGNAVGGSLNVTLDCSLFQEVVYEQHIYICMYISINIHTMHVYIVRMYILYCFRVKRGKTHVEDDCEVWIERKSKIRLDNEGVWTVVRPLPRPPPLHPAAFSRDEAVDEGRGFQAKRVSLPRKNSPKQTPK